MNLKCYVVDDYDFCVENIVQHIDKTPDLELAGTATSALTALEEIRSLKPDIVFTDINIPEMNGITLANHIDDICQVVLVSGSPQGDFIDVDWKNYIYVLKGMGYEQFCQIISTLRLRFDK